MTLCRAAALIAGILFALAIQPAHAGTAACDDWAAKWSLIAGFGKFFKIEGEHRENLVGNFNMAPPQTRLAPDMVGYSWGGGSDFARLYMVADGCVLAERLYPMKLVWQMMGSYPAVPTDMDKSGERYVAQMREQQALRQELEKLALESARQAAGAEGEYDPDSTAGDDQFMEEMD